MTDMIHIGERLHELAIDIRKCHRSWDTWEQKWADMRKKKFLQDIASDLNARYERGDRYILASTHDAIVELASAHRTLRRLDSRIASNKAETARLLPSVGAAAQKLLPAP